MDATSMPANDWLTVDRNKDINNGSIRFSVKKPAEG